MFHIVVPSHVCIIAISVNECGKLFDGRFVFGSCCVAFKNFTASDGSSDGTYYTVCSRSSLSPGKIVAMVLCIPIPIIWMCLVWLKLKKNESFDQPQVIGILISGIFWPLILTLLVFYCFCCKDGSTVDRYYFELQLYIPLCTCSYFTYHIVFFFFQNKYYR